MVREVDFGARHLGTVAAQYFTGHNLMVDLLILREPVVNLPRRAALAQKKLPDGTPNPRSGLARLADFSVITELKVSATQMEDSTTARSCATSASSQQSSTLPKRSIRTGRCPPRTSACSVTGFGLGSISTSLRARSTRPAFAPT